MSMSIDEINFPDHVPRMLCGFPAEKAGADRASDAIVLRAGVPERLRAMPRDCGIVNPKEKDG